MSHYSECHSDNPAGAKFCSACGAPLRVACTKCGQLNRPGSKFCNECGSALAAKEPEARERERAGSGAGQILAAVAEPGVGKSRLFHEFKAEASASWTVLEAFSVSHAKSWAFLPLIEMLQAYFGIVSDDAPSLRRDRAAAKLNGLDPALEGALPFIGCVA